MAFGPEGLLGMAGVFKKFDQLESSTKSQETRAPSRGNN